MQQAKHISRYIKNVKKVFPWGYPNKKKILKELKNKSSHEVVVITFWNCL